MKTLSEERVHELMEIVLQMDQDYDHGLREFQEAIHYCIFYICVSKSKDTDRKDACHAVHYLQDLANRLKKLEDVLAKAS